MNKVVIHAGCGGFNLSKEALLWFKEKYGLDEDQVWKLPRHDKRLVEYVETVYKKPCEFGPSLEVVDIPGNRYLIDDYDGAEKIYYPELTDWIVIED